MKKSKLQCIGELRVIGAAVVLAAVSACTASSDKGVLAPRHRDPASAARQPDAELGETWTTDDEANAAETVSLIQSMLIKRTGDSLVMKRDAHPKHHGCVKAFFKVEPDALPARDRVGIFAHDKEEFQAWVRFSNGDPDSTKPDTDDDVRGMAVKVMGLPESNFLARTGVEAETGLHDFVMMNSPVFFIKNSHDYAGLMKAVAGSGFSLGWFMVTHPKTALILQKARGMKVGNPLQIDYFSATPYRLGADLMRFEARSCVPKNDREKKPDDGSADYLRERLISSLQSDAACFEFLVQVAPADAGLPLENPTVAWSTEKYPYVKVATLRIPKQDGIDTEARMNFCENISYNPWRAPLENRPLGAINRVRLATYGQISDLRHEHNRVAAIQPTSHEICEGETAPLCRRP